MAKQNEPCPFCTEDAVTTSLQETTFPYRSGASQVEVPVTLKVFSCESCGEEFLDHESEDAKQAAIQNLLLEEERNG